MGIRIERKWIVYDSTNCTGVEPQHLCITREDIEKHMKENPMPEDQAYSKEDLIGDITQSEGMLTLMDEMEPETREYVADLINALIS